MRFQQIYDWIEANKPEVILEIGTWNGQSALRMFKYGAKKYIGFDIWEDGSPELDSIENNAKSRVTMEEVQKLLETHDAELIKGNTRDTLPAYAKGKKDFVDMAIIDGGHSRGTIKSDLLTILPIMKASGTVFLDDYYYSCPTPNIGAQTVMECVNVPYTVLPKGEKTKDGYIVKIIKISMRDVPRVDNWEMSEEKSWKFQPA